MPRKDSDRIYKAAHREAYRGYSCVYRETHRDEECARVRAYYEIHQEEIITRHKAYNNAHREECRVYSRAWRAAHLQQDAEKTRRRRALKLGATIGPIDLEAIRVRDKMRCCICGKKVDEKLKHPHPDSLSFDHSWPLGLHGPHSQENQRVAHLHCNVERGIGRLSVQMVLC